MPQENLIFYSPATASNPHPRYLDSVRIQEDGSYIGTYGGQTAEEMAVRFQCEILVMEWTAFSALQDASYIEEPAVISEEVFYEALNVLPPRRWGMWLGIESFSMSEFYTGRITTIYARTHDGRCWRFRDDAYQNGEAIAQKVIAAERKLAGTSVPA